MFVDAGPASAAEPGASRRRVVRTRTLRRRSMADVPLNLAEIEQRIAAVRENIDELIEQAAAYSGAADEELAARRIAEQEALLELLTARPDPLPEPKPPAGPKTSQLNHPIDMIAA